MESSNATPRKHEDLNLYTYLIIGIGCIYSPLYFFKYKALFMAYASMIVTSLVIIMFLLKSKIKSYSLYANFHVLACFIIIFTNMYRVGGVSTPSSLWLIGFPLFATFILGTFYGTLWYIITIVSVCALFILDKAGHQFPFDLSADDLKTTYYITTIAATTSFYLLITITEKIRNRLVKENTKMEEQAFHNAKLISLGETVAGIAHEINNPLTVIHGYIATMKYMREKGKLTLEEVDNYNEKMLKTLVRIDGVIAGMKNFATDTSSKNKQVVSVREIVEDILELSSYHTGSNQTEVEKAIDESCLELKLYCHQVDLTQIFINLINNSRDAIEEEMVQRVLFSVERLSPSQIKIGVYDSGKGIPEDIEKKVFEPFFTTKPVGKGTGIGLSLSHQLAQRNSGELFIDRDQKLFGIAVTLPIYQVDEQDAPPSTQN